MNGIDVKCPTEYHEFPYCDIGSMTMIEVQILYDYLYSNTVVSPDNWIFGPSNVFGPDNETQNVICPMCDGTGIEKVQLLTSVREYPCSKCQGK